MDDRAVSSIEKPPTTFGGSLRRLGPGLILSASIVGSGELIATTALGARVGFTMIWVILLACLFKVALQVEYGRYCIVHGRSALEGWNLGGGPRALGLHWSLFVAFLFLLSMVVGQGGVLGAAAQVGLEVAPALGIAGWVLLLALLIGVLLSRGSYRPVELLAIGMNTIFLLVLGYCLVAIEATDYRFGLADLLSGLRFELPTKGVMLALGTFGIVGLGAAEILIYTYWCLEKGYAAWTGPREDSPEWRQRARGWIGVMALDSIVSMIVYTTATCGFYLLGAAVLRAQPALEDGNGLVVQLSALFTEVLGRRSRSIFLLGGFTVLFSTAFANTAGFARLWSDLLRLAGWLGPNRFVSRRKSIELLTWAQPVIWAVVYLALQAPLFMVVLMGVANTLFLLVVAWKAVAFRYRLNRGILDPPIWYDVALWIGVATTTFVGARGFWASIVPN